MQIAEPCLRVTGILNVCLIHVPWCQTVAEDVFILHSWTTVQCQTCLVVFR